MHRIPCLPIGIAQFAFSNFLLVAIGLAPLQLLVGILARLGGTGVIHFSRALTSIGTSVLVYSDQSRPPEILALENSFAGELEGAGIARFRSGGSSVQNGDRRNGSD